MGDDDKRGIIERLELPPSKRTATPDQIQSAGAHAAKLATEMQTEGRQAKPSIDRLNLIRTEYPDLTWEEITKLRPDLASDLEEDVRAEEKFQSTQVDIADLAGWLEIPAIDLGRTEAGD